MSIGWTKWPSTMHLEGNPSSGGGRFSFGLWKWWWTMPMFFTCGTAAVKGSFPKWSFAESWQFHSAKNCQLETHPPTIAVTICLNGYEANTFLARFQKGRTAGCAASRVLEERGISQIQPVRPAPTTLLPVLRGASRSTTHECPCDVYFSYLLWTSYTCTFITQYLYLYRSITCSSLLKSSIWQSIELLCTQLWLFLPVLTQSLSPSPSPSHTLLSFR